MTRLRGHSALVTGGTGGIGRAVALALGREGALVVVTGRDAARGADVTGRIRDQGGQAVFVKSDLAAGGEAVTLLAREALAAAGGGINILVNNAARLIPAPSMLRGAPEQQTARPLAVNIKAPSLPPAPRAPAMAERGGGVVINMGSINGVVGM